MKIEKGVELGAYLDNLISETIKTNINTKTLEEKDKQTALSGDSKGDDDDDSSDANFDDIKKNQASKTMSDDSDALKGNVKLDDIVNKLNTIRSGKSFKDSVVTQRFNEYFESLSEAEQTAMFAFLKGIAQIVTGEIEPEQAAEPSDDPSNVKMTKGNQDQKKTIKPNVIKTPAPAPGAKPSKSGVEDTSAPKPIQAKKR